jgi:hypothetical protein
LLVVNINGILHAGHTALLSCIRDFLLKSRGGTREERSSLFPQLLVRSKDYTKADMIQDLPELAPYDMAWNAARVTERFDYKFDSDLKEVVDAVMSDVQSLVWHESFANPHWHPTLSPTREEVALLDTQLVLRSPSASSGASTAAEPGPRSATGSGITGIPAPEATAVLRPAAAAAAAAGAHRGGGGGGGGAGAAAAAAAPPAPRATGLGIAMLKDHSFASSMSSLVDRILSLATPKRFGTGMISMQVLVHYLQELLNKMAQEHSRFHLAATRGNAGCFDGGDEDT